MTFTHFLCLCFTFIAFGLLFERTLTALGRVLVVVAWLAVIAVTLALPAHGQATTQDDVNKIQRLAAGGIALPSPPPTPTDGPIPVPTFDPSRIRCTQFYISPNGITAVPGPAPLGGYTYACCALWTGNKWGQGTWAPLGCTR